MRTQFETAGGNELNSRRPATMLSVKRSIHAVHLVFRTRTAAANKLTGRVGVRFGKWRGLPAIAPARGRLTLQRGTRKVVLQSAGLRLDSLAVPTRTRLRLRIIASAGYRGCPLGARATLLVTDCYNVRRDGRTTTLVLSLPPACGGKIIPTATLTFSAS